MKILYFRLKGYGGIFQGMGLDEIVIPFSEFHNNVVLIQGSNGCGKSTIMNALSMEIDGSFYYRTDYIPGVNGEVVQIEYPAEKEIHYIDNDGTIYRILIVSPVSNNKRMVTKAYISRNGEELNTTGNVSSYKEIMESEFELDMNFLALSIVTSEKRGLVDKTPSERKKFMSSVMSSLDFYNNAYKSLSKKSTVYKANINTLSNKIYSIGDEIPIRTSLSSIDIRLSNLETTRESLKAKLVKNDTMIQNIDPSSQIQSVYQRIHDELGEVNNALTKYESGLLQLYGALNINRSNDDIGIIRHNTTKRIEDTERTNSKLDYDLRYCINEQEEAAMSIANKQNKLDGLQSDINYEETIKLANELSRKVSKYESMIDMKSLLRLDMSKDEILFVIDTLHKIKESIRDIKRDEYSNAYNLAIAMIRNGYVDLLGDINETIRSIDIEISNTEIEISVATANIDTLSILSNRPDSCNNDDCYFIQNAIRIEANNPHEKLDALLNRKDTLCGDLSKATSDLDYAKDIMDIYNDMLRVLSMIDTNLPLLRKLPIAKVLMDRETFLNALESESQFNEFEDTGIYLKYIDIIDDYNESKRILLTLQADIKIYENKMSIVNDLIKEIDDTNIKLEGISEKIVATHKEISFNKDLINSLSKLLIRIDKIIEMESGYKEATEKKQSLKNEFEGIKEDIKKIKVYVDSNNTILSDLSNLEKELNPLKEQKEELKYSLSLLATYNQDLAIYKEHYDTIEFIRKCCSPSSGIQTIYMSIYLNKTISLANELLSNFFNGDIRLDNPEINQNEFRIPFVGPSGIPVSDISTGSTSQRCMMSMVLSFVLLMQGSIKYNILRLDEIDGGLDTENRMVFTSVLYMLMEVLNVSQSILISHSIETETYNVDIIHVSKNGLSFIKGGN